MNIKILEVLKNGEKSVECIEIESFYWGDNHTFYYVPIYNGHSISRYLELKPNQDLVGLSL